MERRILGRLKGDATEQFHASQGLLALQVHPRTALTCFFPSPLQMLRLSLAASHTALCIQEAVDHFGADHPFTQVERVS